MKCTARQSNFRLQTVGIDVGWLSQLASALYRVRELEAQDHLDWTIRTQGLYTSTSFLCL